MTNALRAGLRMGAMLLLGIGGCQGSPTEPPTALPEPPLAQVPLFAHPISFVDVGKGTQRIYIIRSDGTGLSLLNENTVYYAIPAHSSWSPAGVNRIAFRHYVELNGQVEAHLAVIHADGTGFQDLTPVGARYVWYSAWSPDGNRFAFEDGEERLMVVNADGSGLDTIAGNKNLGGFAWSPDGQRIAYFAWYDSPRTPFNDRGIWSVKVDGTGRVKLRHVPGNADYESMQFSPDGTWLAMCHTIPGGSELDFMHADGTGLIHLPLECRGGQHSPQWSPDGTRILSGYPDLYTVDPNGQNFAQLTFDGADAAYDEARWSRQGTKIAYTRSTLTRGEYDMALFTMSANGQSKQRLSPVEMEVDDPSWGP